MGDGKIFRMLGENLKKTLPWTSVVFGEIPFHVLVGLSYTGHALDTFASGQQIWIVLRIDQTLQVKIDLLECFEMHDKSQHNPSRAPQLRFSIVLALNSRHATFLVFRLWGVIFGKFLERNWGTGLFHLEIPIQICWFSGDPFSASLLIHSSRQIGNHCTIAPKHHIQWCTGFSYLHQWWGWTS